MSTFQEELRSLQHRFTARVYSEILKDLMKISPDQTVYPPIDPVTIVLDTITRNIQLPANYSGYHIDPDCSKPPLDLERFFTLCSTIFSTSYVKAKRTCFKSYKLLGNVMMVLDTFIRSQPMSHWLRCMVTEILETHRIHRRGSVGLQSPLGGRRPVTVEHIEIRGKSLADAWARFCKEHPESGILPRKPPSWEPRAPDTSTFASVFNKDLTDPYGDPSVIDPRRTLVERTFGHNSLAGPSDLAGSTVGEPAPEKLAPTIGGSTSDLTTSGNLVTANLPIFLGTAATAHALESIQARDFSEIGAFRTLCPMTATHTSFHPMSSLLWAFFKHDITKAELHNQWDWLFGHKTCHQGLVIEVMETPPAAFGYAQFTLDIDHVEVWSYFCREFQATAHADPWKSPEFLNLRQDQFPILPNTRPPSPFEKVPDPSGIEHWPAIIHAPELPAMRRFLKDYGVPEPAWRSAHCSVTAQTYLAQSIEKVYAISYERTPSRLESLKKVLGSLSCSRPFSGRRFARSGLRASLASTASSVGTLYSREKSSVAR